MVLRKITYPWFLISVLSILTAFVTHSLDEQVELKLENDNPGVRWTPAVLAVQKAMPAVVNISTEKVQLQKSPLDDYFREFFYDFWQKSNPQYKTQSLGSGVIIDSEGYLLTNWHVVQRASRTTATLATTGEQFEAKVIAVMPETDLALLKLVTGEIDQTFPSISFEKADDLLLGEEVMTLGNPFGLGGSVSKGILSSKNRRSVPTSDHLEVDDWLQTDAAINLGNSGGPLINLNGNLIGINVATISGGQNIGFSIPVRRVMETMAHIFSPEKMTRTWIGLKLDPISSLPIVASVENSSPAFEAGLKPGDRITHYNNRELKNLFDLQKNLVAASPGKKIYLTVESLDQGKTILEVMPTALSDYFNMAYVQARTGMILSDNLYSNNSALSEQLRKAFKVEDVSKDSVADVASLRENDIIINFNGTSFNTIEELGWWLSYFESGYIMDIMIQRQETIFPGTTQYFPYKGKLKLN